jgi:hypothetical protein
MPRGVDYFPNPEHRDWARAYDRNLLDWQHRQIRAHNRNFDTQPITALEYNAVHERLLPQFNMWLEERGEIENRLWNVPDLDPSKLPEKALDRPKLRPFKLEYDTLNEVSMRFKGSVIQIKGHPFHVTDVRQDRADRRFYFLVEDYRDKKAKVCLDQIDDLRNLPPGFVQFDTYPVWMSRVPARSNQQGMNNQNTALRRVATDGNVPYNSRQLCHALASQGVSTKWEVAYHNLLVNRIVPEFRLSDRVAMFTKKGNDPVYVAYRGRVFGKLTDQNVVTADDEDDLVQGWIKKHFNDVNLEVRS